MKMNTSVQEQILMATDDNYKEASKMIEETARK